MEKLFLNKSEAAHYLHTLYERYTEANGLDDIEPNFFSLVSESIRNPNSGSALKAGRPRGNRSKYAPIDHIRTKTGKPLFSRPHIECWFESVYVPALLADIKATALKIDRRLGVSYLIRA